MEYILQKLLQTKLLYDFGEGYIDKLRSYNLKLQFGKAI